MTVRLTPSAGPSLDRGLFAGPARLARWDAERDLLNHLMSGDATDRFSVIAAPDGDAELLTDAEDVGLDRQIEPRFRSVGLPPPSPSALRPSAPRPLYAFHAASAGRSAIPHRARSVDRFDGRGRRPEVCPARLTNPAARSDRSTAEERHLTVRERGDRHARHEASAVRGVVRRRSQLRRPYRAAEARRVGRVSKSVVWQLYRPQHVRPPAAGFVPRAVRGPIDGRPPSAATR